MRKHFRPVVTFFLVFSLAGCSHVQSVFLQPFKPEEFLPGPAVGDDDASLAKAAGDIGTTIFHPVGTAKMGIASDPMAVVDERLRLRGVAGLRVIDASIMPTITSGNTNTPTIMIAEKAAQMVIEDGRSTRAAAEVVAAS